MQLFRACDDDRSGGNLLHFFPKDDRIAFLDKDRIRAVHGINRSDIGYGNGGFTARFLAETVYQADRKLGGAHIVTGTVIEELTARKALIRFIVETDITHCGFRFHAPTPGEIPAVAVADAAARIPAVMPVVTQVLEQAEREMHVADIVLTAQCVQGEKMPP